MSVWSSILFASCAGFDDSGVRAKRYEYNELRVATKNFAEERKLGQGAYGAVYKVLINLNYFFSQFKSTSSVMGNF